MHVTIPHASRSLIRLLTFAACTATLLLTLAAIAMMAQQPASKPAPSQPAPPAPVTLAPKSSDQLLAVKLAARDLTVATLNVQHLVDEANKQLVQLNLQQQLAQKQLDAEIAKVKLANSWGADVEWDATREQFVKQQPAQPAK